MAARQSGRYFECRARWRTSDSSGLVDRLFSSIAVDVHFEDRGVMDEAVDRGERDGGVAEDLAPFGEQLIGAARCATARLRMSLLTMVIS